jgi:predicted amidophosphoribosyltransferase
LSIFANSKKFILDTLFPIHCLSCQAEGSFICAECLAEIPPLPFQVCPKCEKLMTENGKLCERCKKNKPPLDALVAAAKYKQNNIAELVHLFKYNFAADLSAPLGALLIKIILKNNLPLPDVIVPVPLHPRRKRWRGFNQAELLADYICENLAPGFKIPVFPDLIVRQKYTPPQMKIGKYAERRKNMQGAFAINKNIDNKGHRMSFGRFAWTFDVQNLTCHQDFLHNKKILLIDDICTTGATLFECAKILKASGAKKIYAGVIARQEFE